MTSRDFCYWLQGFFELGGASTTSGGMMMITPLQAEIIKGHLNMVFVHEIDPSIATPGSEKDNVLNNIHHSFSTGETGEKMRC